MTLRRPASLRGRLAFLALFTTAGWMIVLTVGFNVFLGARLRAEANDLLHTRAAAVSATVGTSPAGTLTVRDPRDDSALDTGTWIYQGRRAIERPRAPAAVQARADALAGTGARFGGLDEPAGTRFYALPIMDGRHQAGTAVVAVSTDPYRRMARLALAGSAGLALLILAGVQVVTRTVIGRALDPVAQMSAQAAEWSEHETDHRFGTARRPTELAALAGNLNELLDRLAAALRHERQLSAELSHELRTPLARISAETELLLSRPRGAAERRTAYEAIAAGAAQMGDILETLLTTARAGVTGSAGRCDVGGLVQRLAEEARTADPAGPAVRVRQAGDDVVADAPEEIVERILTPILGNALRYAADQVTFTVRAEHGVRISVSDDGPGVPADLATALFDPGRRGDPDDGHDGAGLGLALARRLARAAGGDVVLARPAWDTTFEIRLPPA
jgi:signal transduction histidine kinase